MWAILGLWAVQDGIDNSNDDCTDCNFTVPNIETSRGGAISYTDGRVVRPGYNQLAVIVYILTMSRTAPPRPTPPTWTPSRLPSPTMTTS